MKMFSQCSGECCVCRCGTACLAGHGDDDYIPAKKEQVIDRLDKGMYPNYREQMKEYLLERFSFVYEEHVAEKKSAEPDTSAEKGLEGETCVICHKCGGVMLLRTANEDFSVNGEVVKIDGVKEYFCENCGETSFKGSEVERIQSIIDQKQQDI